MLDKIKDWLPQIGTIVGFLGLGKVQGIVVGVVATTVFIAGLNVGQKLGFRDGYREGQKSCEKDDDRRRIWPFREDEEDPVDLTPVEMAAPIQ